MMRGQRLRKYLLSFSRPRKRRMMGDYFSFINKG
jgi:hypothetical protein